MAISLPTSSIDSAYALENRPSADGSTRAKQFRRVWIASPILAFLVGILACINTYMYSEEDPLVFGRFSIALTMLIPLLAGALQVHQGHMINSRLFRPLIWFALLAIACLPKQQIDVNSLKPLMQISLVAGFFLSVASFYWSTASITCLSTLAKIWLAGAIVLWIIQGLPTPLHLYFFNPNVAGASIAILLGVAMLRVPSHRQPWLSLANYLLFGVSSILIAATMARAATLALLVTVAVYYCWPYLCRSRQAFRFAFTLAIFSIALFVLGQTVVVEYLSNSGVGDLAHQLTGERIATRTQVWSLIIQAIQERPFFGHGTTLSTEEIIGQELSAHCVFLQVTFQSGLFGLLCLIAVLHSIWNLLWAGKRDPVVRVSAAIFMGVLVHQTFEVALTENHLCIGMIGWLIFAIGVARSINPTTTNKAIPHNSLQPNTSLA